jgi:hypothetical protein
MKKTFSQLELLASESKRMQEQPLLLSRLKKLKNKRSQKRNVKLLKQ